MWTCPNLLLSSVADPAILKRGAADNVSALLSFFANANNEL